MISRCGPSLGKDTPERDLVKESPRTPDGKPISFRGKNYGHWVQPVDGGERQRLEGPPKVRLYDFSWSRDGKWLAFARGPEIRDVVLIESSSQ
ncbi:MAG: hypothetical protein ABIZ95_02530 [Pyrinomonadaceae bacterium]